MPLTTALQEDLVTDDVFILDAYDNIFLWVGEESRPEEKTMAMDAALVGHVTWRLKMIDFTTDHTEIPSILIIN